jgi:hypothetical protein
MFAAVPLLEASPSSATWERASLLDSQPPGRGPVQGRVINYTEPSYCKERIYRAAVSQGLRLTALDTHSTWPDLSDFSNNCAAGFCSEQLIIPRISMQTHLQCELCTLDAVLSPQRTVHLHVLLLSEPYLLPFTPLRLKSCLLFRRSNYNLLYFPTRYFVLAYVRLPLTFTLYCSRAVKPLCRSEE